MHMFNVQVVIGSDKLTTRFVKPINVFQLLVLVL